MNVQLLGKKISNKGIQVIRTNEETDLEDAGIDLEGGFSIQYTPYMSDKYFLMREIDGGMETIGVYRTQKLLLELIVQKVKV
jgi:hypothetical protein